LGGGRMLGGEIGGGEHREILAKRIAIEREKNQKNKKQGFGSKKFE